MVRGLGPGLPCRCAGPRRPGAGQGPAAPAGAGVVPAPERPAAGLRVGLRRREPAGAGLGRAARLQPRRPAGLRLPGPDLPQAPAQLHLVGQPRGCVGGQRLHRRVPRAGQHRPDRPLAPAGRSVPGPGRRDGLDGALLPRPAQPRGPAGRPRPDVRGPGDHVLRALRADRGRLRPARAVGRGRRLLLRPAAVGRGGAGGRAGSVVRRPDAAGGDRGARRGRRAAAARLLRAAGDVPAQAAGPGDLRRHRQRSRPAADVRRQRGAPGPDPASGRRPGRVLVRSRHPVPVEGAPGRPGADRGRRCRSRRPTTSRGSRRPGSMAATPTGAARSGCRPTCCSPTACASTPGSTTSQVDAAGWVDRRRSPRSSSH